MVTFPSFGLEGHGVQPPQVVSFLRGTMRQGAGDSTSKGKVCTVWILVRGSRFYWMPFQTVLKLFFGNISLERIYRWGYTCRFEASLVWIWTFWSEKCLHIPLSIRLYLYSRYWTGTSLQPREVFWNANDINLFLMIFRRMNVHCKLVPVQYREYESVELISSFS